MHIAHCTCVVAIHLSAFVFYIFSYGRQFGKEKRKKKEWANKTSIEVVKPFCMKGESSIWCKNVCMVYVSLYINQWEDISHSDVGHLDNWTFKNKILFNLPDPIKKLKWKSKRYVDHDNHTNVCDKSLKNDATSHAQCTHWCTAQNAFILKCAVIIMDGFRWKSTYFLINAAPTCFRVEPKN